MTTVTRNPKPHPMAHKRSRRLSSRIRAAYPGDEYRNSEVKRRIIVVTASHKLISEIVKGKIIFSLYELEQGVNATVWRQRLFFDEDCFA